MLIRFNVKNFLSFSASEDGKSEEYRGRSTQEKEHFTGVPSPEQPERNQPSGRTEEPETGTPGWPVPG